MALGKIAETSAEKRTMTQLALAPPWTKVSELWGMFAKVVKVVAAPNVEAMNFPFNGLQLPVTGGAGAAAVVDTASISKPPHSSGRIKRIVMVPPLLGTA
jgi:hypothetical protein